MNEKQKKAVAALRKLGQRLRHGWDGFHPSGKISSLKSVKADLKKKWLNEERWNRFQEESERMSSLADYKGGAASDLARKGREKRTIPNRPSKSTGSRARRKANRRTARRASSKSAKTKT